MKTPDTTPSPAPQQWAKDAAREIFPGPMTSLDPRHISQVNTAAAIITKHAAAISEENQRLRGEIDQLVMERDHFHDERDTLRQWTEPAREALNFCAWPNYSGGESASLLKTLIERQEAAQKALQSHPAATNLTEEGKK